LRQHPLHGPDRRLVRMYPSLSYRLMRLILVGLCTMRHGQQMVAAAGAIGLISVQVAATLLQNFPVVALVDATRGQAHRALVPIGVGGRALEEVADRDDFQSLTALYGHREAKLR
jgi:hypothetical protein